MTQSILTYVTDKRLLKKGTRLAVMLHPQELNLTPASLEGVVNGAVTRKLEQRCREIRIYYDKNLAARGEVIDIDIKRKKIYAHYQITEVYKI